LQLFPQETRILRKISPVLERFPAHEKCNRLIFSDSIFEKIVCRAQGVLVIKRLSGNFAPAMYFRFSLRHNPGKGKSDAYYRLIVCQ
jgi:hypothetical protein